MQEFNHYSVLLKESIEGLNIKTNGIYVDATLGGGGHSSEILKKLKTGFLYAFDQDISAVNASCNKLKKINNNFEIINDNFVNLKEQLQVRKVNKIDGIIFDLGVSSPQFDTVERGFSYKYNAKLDMRMNLTQELSAYEVVNNYSFNDLYYIISRYGEERFAKSIARGIEKARIEAKIETTFDLVDIIKKAMPQKAKRDKHPAKRTFQAIRIEVNKELEILPKAFEDAIDLLNIGGRICVITFHSLEDRICAKVLKKHANRLDVPQGLPVIPEEFEPILKMINKKAIKASDSELEENNRSHSAKLRIAEKLKEK